MILAQAKSGRSSSRLGERLQVDLEVGRLGVGVSPARKTPVHGTSQEGPEGCGFEGQWSRGVLAYCGMAGAPPNGRKNWH